MMSTTSQEDSQATIFHGSPPSPQDEECRPLTRSYIDDDSTLYNKSPVYGGPEEFFDNRSPLQDLQFSAEICTFESNSFDDYTNTSHFLTSEESLISGITVPSYTITSQSSSKSPNTKEHSADTDTELSHPQSVQLDETTEHENFRDTLPATFLALKGISVANYNMGCNFSVDTAITIMNQHQLFILTIQEHSPWNRDLTQLEKECIIKTCDKWAFHIIITKLQ
jgi:hypothetical protein